MEAPQRGRFGPAPYSTSPRTLGWVIAGAGHTAAPRFAQAIRDLPPRRDDASVQARVIGVHSRSAVLADRFASAFHLAHASDSLETLLERPDVRAVYVANHPRHHTETVLAALQAGKHVLCEPPLSQSMDDCIGLYHTARDRGLTLGVNYQHRQDPAFVVARHRLLEGELGELVAVRASVLPMWTPLDLERRTDPAWGGILSDTMLRLIDALRFVAGERFSTASAAAGPALFSDAALADIHCILGLERTGALVTAYASWQIAHGLSQMEWLGTRQTMTIAPWRRDATSGLALHGKSTAHETLPDIDLWQQSILAFQTAVFGEFDPPATAADDAVNLCVAETVARALQSASRTQVWYPYDLTGVA